MKLNISINKKIWLGFGVQIALMLVVGGIGLWSVFSADANFHRQETLNLSLHHVETLSSSMYDQALSLEDYTHHPSDEHLAAFRKTATQVDADVLALVKNLSGTDLQDEAQAISAQNDAFNVFFENAGKGVKGENSSVDTARASGEKAIKALDELSGYLLETGNPREALMTKDVNLEIALTRIAVLYYLRTYDPQYTAAARDHLGKAAAVTLELKDMLNDQHALDLCDTALQGIDAYDKSMIEITTASADKDAALQKMEEAEASIMQAIGNLNQVIDARVEDLTKDLAAASSLANYTMMLAVAVAVLTGLAIAWALARAISLPLYEAIDGLTSGSKQVSSAAGEIALTSQKMASGASEQAASIQETSASLEEITSMVKSNADNTHQANQMSGEVQTAAQRSTEAMSRMRQAIDEISASANETAKIIKTIDDIAFQTNLLALNAAVEAARAGDAGRGFAVVAEEVRSLAQRSATAAKDTAALIQQAQGNAANGVQVSHDVDTALKEISERIHNVAQLMTEVYSASDEQSRGVEQIGAAVSQMDSTTQSSAAMAEEAAAAAEELNAQSSELLAVVDSLVELVNGGKSEMKARPAKEVGKPVAKTKLASKQAVKAVAAPAAKPAPAKAEGAKTPAQIIPLDESDFAGF